MKQYLQQRNNKDLFHARKRCIIVETNMRVWHL